MPLELAVISASLAFARVAIAPIFNEVYSGIQRTRSEAMFCRALLQDDPEQIRRIIESGISVNSLIRWKGEDGRSYSATRLAAAIIFHEFGETKSTLSCVRRLMELGANETQPGICCDLQDGQNVSGVSFEQRHHLLQILLDRFLQEIVNST